VSPHHWFHRRQELAAQPSPAARRILAIDGGGIRGIIPAMVLAELEDRTGQPACQLFDLLAGTSTGGIIALGMAVPGPDGAPAFSAADGVRLYEERGAHIFSRSARDTVLSLGNLLHEKYPARGIEAELQTIFGAARLSDALTDVLVTAYEIVRRETFFFSSAAARQDAARNFTMQEAARSATAAPTFFEPSLVHDPVGGQHVLIDGAIFANSPAMCAFTQVERDRSGGDLVLVSLGAGSMTRRFEYDEVRDWGAAQWARPILSLVLDGVSQSTDEELADLLGPERYFRFQVELTRASDDLDDVDPQNIQALKAEARQMIDDNGAQLDRICALLVR